MTRKVFEDQKNASKKKKTKKTCKTGITKARPKKFLRMKCPICFAKLDKQSPVSSTACGHVFCTSCIETALNLRAVCPICRKYLGRLNAHHPLFLDYEVN